MHSKIISIPPPPPLSSYQPSPVLYFVGGEFCASKKRKWDESGRGSVGGEFCTCKNSEGGGKQSGEVDCGGENDASDHPVTTGRASTL